MSARHGVWAGWYVPSKHPDDSGVLMRVEEIDTDWNGRVATAIHLGLMYQQGAKLPSRYWCVWRGSDFGFFDLSQIDAEQFEMPPEKYLNEAQHLALGAIDLVC